MDVKVQQIQNEIRQAVEMACGQDGYFVPTAVSTIQDKNGYLTSVQVFCSEGFFDFRTKYPEGYPNIDGDDRRKALKTIVTLKLKKLMEELEGAE